MDMLDPLWDRKLGGARPRGSADISRVERRVSFVQPAQSGVPRAIFGAEGVRRLQRLSAGRAKDETPSGAHSILCHDFVPIRQ